MQKDGHRQMNNLVKLYNWLVDNYYRKNYKILGLFIFLLLTSGFLTVYLVCLFISFVSRNFETIVTLLVGIIALILYIIEGRKERLKKLQEEQAKELAKRQAIQEKANIKAIEENYKMLSRILFQALTKVSDVLGLKEVATERDLESPVHHISMDDFYLYQFVVYRKNTAMEIGLLQEVLQEEINRIIGTGQVLGLQKMTHYLYNGQFYPCVIIHDISENIGYLQISIAIASDEYLRYRQMQSLAILNDNTTSMIRPYDKDF